MSSTLTGAGSWLARLDARVTAAFPPDLERAYAVVDRLCLRLALRVARRYSLFDRARLWSIADVVATARAHRQALYFLSCVCRALAEEGYLRSTARGFELLRPLRDPDALGVPYLAEYAREPLVRLISRCEEGFDRFVAGSRRGIDVVFPHGGLELWRELHARDVVMSPYARAAAVAADALASPGAEILEVGAGTGAVSGCMQTLDIWARVSTYLFTDVSGLFLREAVRRHESDARIRVARFDINEDGREQLGDRRFDLIVAANTVHVARDLCLTLRRLGALLRDGGWLCLAEGSPPGGGRMWRPDLVFGFLDGWWSVTSDAYRPAPGFLSAAQWRAALRASGFRNVLVVSPPCADARGGIVLAGSPR